MMAMASGCFGPSTGNGDGVLAYGSWRLSFAWHGVFGYDAFILDGVRSERLLVMKDNDSMTVTTNVNSEEHDI